MSTLMSKDFQWFFLEPSPNGAHDSADTAAIARVVPAGFAIASLAIHRRSSSFGGRYLLREAVDGRGGVRQQLDMRLVGSVSRQGFVGGSWEQAEIRLDSATLTCRLILEYEQTKRGT